MESPLDVASKLPEGHGSSIDSLPFEPNNLDEPWSVCVATTT